ncbi:hypothetical protein LHV56_03420 [Peribacillus frigoritolerans]|uniref:hypothetical protein n=1 Tax=Peribacillus frigoritolerans TaxID=450367 RepID=UPI002079D753|nr:hypothetical protein [Peribacillus frigoritolerans]MDM5304615.1 hypothetical protein [Peribacillus frigoritolerans]USK81024.1 hypothetical protein LHV56_03420 [Peribacillus frigoritolerans]
MKADTSERVKILKKNRIAYKSLATSGSASHVNEQYWPGYSCAPVHGGLESDT